LGADFFADFFADDFPLLPPNAASQPLAYFRFEPTRTIVTDLCSFYFEPTTRGAATAAAPSHSMMQQNPPVFKGRRGRGAAPRGARDGQSRRRPYRWKIGKWA
jgi:hypothetical protein